MRVPQTPGRGAQCTAVATKLFRLPAPPDSGRLCRLLEQARPARSCALCPARRSPAAFVTASLVPAGSLCAALSPLHAGTAGVEAARPAGAGQRAHAPAAAAAARALAAGAWGQREQARASDERRRGQLVPSGLLGAGNRGAAGGGGADDGHRRHRAELSDLQAPGRGLHRTFYTHPFTQLCSTLLCIAELAALAPGGTAKGHKAARAAHAHRCRSPGRPAAGGRAPEVRHAVLARVLRLHRAEPGGGASPSARPPPVARLALAGLTVVATLCEPTRAAGSMRTPLPRGGQAAEETQAVPRQASGARQRQQQGADAGRARGRRPWRPRSRWTARSWRATAAWRASWASGSRWAASRSAARTPSTRTTRTSCWTPPARPSPRTARRGRLPPCMRDTRSGGTVGERWLVFRESSGAERARCMRDTAWAPHWASARSSLWQASGLSVRSKHLED